MIITKHYHLSKELINKKNIHIFVDSGIINITFSEQLRKEILKLPKNKVRDIIHDIRKGVEYFCLFKPNTQYTMETVRQEIISTLNQVW